MLRPPAPVGSAAQREGHQQLQLDRFEPLEAGKQGQAVVGQGLPMNRQEDGIVLQGGKLADETHEIMKAEGISHGGRTAALAKPKPELGQACSLRLVRSRAKVGDETSRRARTGCVQRSNRARLFIPRGSSPNPSLGAGISISDHRRNA